MVEPQEMCWFPQTSSGDGDGLPLQLPPGGSYGDHPDVRFALAAWAHARGLSHAVAVREDGEEKISIWITTSADGWEWMKDNEL